LNGVYLSWCEEPRLKQNSQLTYIKYRSALLAWAKVSTEKRERGVGFFGDNINVVIKSFKHVVLEKLEKGEKIP